MAGTDVKAAKAKQQNGNANEESSLVLQMIQKRLRNARKRLRGIEDIQAKADAGKALNEDQESALQSRPGVVAIIDELERLSKAMEEPLKQELEAVASVARKEGEEAGAAAAAAAAPPPPKKTDKEWEKELKSAVSKARSDERAKATAKVTTRIDNAANKAAHEAIEALCELLYFSSVFDKYTNKDGPGERSACLMEAHHANPENLTITDGEFDTLCIIGRALQVRPYGSAVSHEDALATCKEAAVRAIRDPEASVFPQLPGVTGKQLKELLDKVKALNFYRTPVNPAAAAGHAAVPPNAMPAVPPSTPAPMQPGFAAAAVVAQQQISAVTAALPAAVAAPAAEPVRVESAPAPSTENLMSKIFGAAALQQRQHSYQQQHLHVQVPAAAQEQQLRSSGPPAFAGDSELGIEGIPLDGVETEQQQQQSDVNMVTAPTPGAVPAPSSAVLIAGAGNPAYYESADAANVNGGRAGAYQQQQQQQGGRRRPHWVGGGRGGSGQQNQGDGYQQGGRGSWRGNNYRSGGRGGNRGGRGNSNPHYGNQQGVAAPQHQQQ